MVDVVKKCNEIGVMVFGFIDKVEVEFVILVDYLIFYLLNE